LCKFVEWVPIAITTALSIHLCQLPTAEKSEKMDYPILDRGVITRNHSVKAQKVMSPQSFVRHSLDKAICELKQDDPFLNPTRGWLGTHRRMTSDVRGQAKSTRSMPESTSPHCAREPEVRIEIRRSSHRGHRGKRDCGRNSPLTTWGRVAQLHGPSRPS